MPVRGPGEQVVADERPHLVAAQYPPAAGLGAGRDGHGQSVRVRVVGENQIGADRFGFGNGKVECAWFFGIGFGQGREVRVRFGLEPHHVRGSKASPVERGEQYLAADTVKRGVHDPDVVGIDRGQGGDDGIEVVVDDVRADRFAAITQRDFEPAARPSR